MITVEKLAAFAPHADAVTLAPLLDGEAARRYIITNSRISHWLAQIAVETAYFRQFEENLDYTAARIAAVWPSRFNETSAGQYAGAPEALANVVYGGRMGNGPAASGDGWRYRGRGFLDSTGRDEYARLAKLTGLDLVADPDLLLQPVNGVRAAGAFWQDADLNLLADRDALASITRAVSGGLGSLPLRQQALNLARKVWS